MTDEPDIEAIARGRSPMDNEKLIEAIAQSVWGDPFYRPLRYREGIEAALRAHAEWMRENGMVIMVQGWQPIETAPRDDDEGPFIMVFGPDGIDKARWIGWLCDPYWQRPVTAEYDNEDARVTSPTHWMHLPEPPMIAAAQGEG